MKIAIALAALSLAGAAHAATIPVANLAALAPALKAAKPGDVLQLAPGEYRNLKIVGFAAAGAPVTIQGQPGVILTGNPSIANSSGLTLAGLEVDLSGGTDPYFAFRITGVHDFALDQLDVHGGTVTAILIRQSANIAITGSKFHNSGTAINETANTGVLIANNAFSELAGDAMDNSGASQVTIRDNNCTNFRAPVGFHTDCIQFWTTAQTVVASDIVIRGNVYFKGAGNPAQGVFMNDEAGNLPYHNVTIDNNTMVGGIWNALYLRAGSGVVVITNNTLETWPQPDSVTTPGGAIIPNLKARLYINNMAGVTSFVETGNAAQGYITQTQTLPTPPGNTLIGPVTDNGAAAMRAWLRGNLARQNLSDDFAKLIAP